MQIDWITVTAQIINFLVLVYLLQHFLYQPIVRAMDKRERRVTDRLNEASQRESDAEQAKETYEQKKNKLEAEHKELMQRFEREAREAKQKMMEEARGEVDAAKRQWQKQLEQDKRKFLDNLRRQTAHTVTEVAGKALTDLADAELEERVIGTFITRLENLGDDTLKVFSGGDGALRVTTAHELDPRQRGRITRALHETLGSDREVEYAQAEELVCGIRLGDEGHALDWNLADYMSQITERMNSAVDEAARQS